MNKARILIVEDNATAAEARREELRSMGYGVVGIALSESEAVTGTMAARPDLVLMDIKPGEARGVTEEVQHICDHLGTPVLYLAAVCDEWFLERAGINESFGYVRKPYVARELQSGIETALRLDWLKRQLQQLEERLATMLEGVGEGIIVTDTGCRVEMMNSLAEGLTGWGRQEAIGRRLAEVVRLKDDKSDEALKDPAERALASGGRAVDLSSCRLIGREDKEALVSCSGSATFDDRGQCQGAVIVFRDISYHREMEERARHHQAALAHVGRVRTIEQMAAGLSHELKQPLAAIRSLTEACVRMIRSKAASLDEIEDGLGEVVKQACRAGEIVQRIKRFVRKQDSHRARVDMNQVVRQALRLVANEALRCDVVIDLQLCPEVLEVEADTIQIEQVIVNIARNGFEAMSAAEPAQRKLTVFTGMASDPGQVEVAIRDAGTGFTAEMAEKVFESFFTTKPEGLGIGLPLSRSIIESHGGRLWSRCNPDRGATFLFTLPTLGNERE